MNLVINAGEAIGEGRRGRVVVSTRRVSSTRSIFAPTSLVGM